MPHEQSHRKVIAIEQHHECTAEKPIRQEIGGEIHHDGCLLIEETRRNEEMHSIVGRQRQQCHSHDATGTDIVPEDLLVGCLRHKKIDREEYHQHQSDTE